MRLASLVKACLLYAASTALSNSLCAFTKLGGIVNGLYKSAKELLGKEALTSNTFCAFSSIVFICFYDGFSGHG